MQTLNNTTLFVQSMNQKFKIRFLTSSINDANDFMKNNLDTSVIDETDSGIIIIANNIPE
jgi:hypothetical protein